MKNKIWRILNFIILQPFYLYMFIKLSKSILKKMDNLEPFTYEEMIVYGMHIDSLKRSGLIDIET